MMLLRTTLLTAFLAAAASAAQQVRQARRRLTADCYLNGDPNACRLSSFAKGVPQVIEAGGDTGCIFGDAFQFQVTRGSSKKVLVYFEENGACIDAVTTLGLLPELGGAPQCTTTPTFSDGGVLDVSDNRNPFKKYTIVDVGYCSGDLYIGDKNTTYVGPGGPVDASYRGKANTQIVLDWLVAQQAYGDIEDDDDDLKLALVGENFGGIGVQNWGVKFVSALGHPEDVTIIVDSGFGVFPENAIQLIEPNINPCPFFDTPMVAAKCSAGTLTQADVTLDQFSHLDHSVKYTFASIKQDFLQTGTYNLILGVVVAAGIPTTSLPFLDGGGQPDATQFYDEANLLLQGYIDAGADFIAFWVDDGGASAVSTLTDEARFFDAVSSSPGFSGDTGEVDTLFCWVKAVRKLDTDDDDNEVCTQCAPQTAANILDIPPFPAAADPRRGEYCEVDVLAQCIGGGDDDDDDNDRRRLLSDGDGGDGGGDTPQLRTRRVA